MGLIKYEINGDILEVVEERCSPLFTKKTFWYFNIKLWLRSVTGKQNEQPTREMTSAEIERVQNLLSSKPENNL